MKKYISLFIIILFCASNLNAQKVDRSQPPKAAPASKIELGSYESFTLENGLQVFVVENHKLPRVSFQLSIDSDPMMEAKNAGIGDIVGSLIRTGTTNKSKSEIDEEIDFIGATLSPSANGIYGLCLSKHSDKLLGLMSDVLMNPTFPEEELEKVRKQTLSDIESQQTDPTSIARNVAKVLRYGKEHPYGEVKSEESIKNITTEACKNYFNSKFIPNQSYLVIVGDMGMKEAKSKVEKYFGSWKKGRIAKMEYPTPKAPDSREVTFVDKAGAAQSYILLTYPVNLKPGSDDAIKARVMNSILGAGGFSSRLFQNLREDKAYTYGAYSSLRSDKLVGAFTAAGSVRNEVTDSSIVEFLYEMKRIVDEDISAEDLQLTKNILTGNFARSLESPQTIARFALNTAKYNLPKDYYSTYLEKLEAVTISDVRAMAKKYVKPDNAHVLVVGSKGEVADKLSKFGKSGEISYLDFLGNKVEAVTAEVPMGVTAQTIIDKFIVVTGGEKNWKKIKTVSTAMKTEMQGMEIFIDVNQAKDKYAQKVTANGMTINQTIINGEVGVSKGMQGNKDLSKEEAQAELLKNGIMPELGYEGVFRTDLKGMDKINGELVYVIEVTAPNGDKHTDYFSQESGMKVRTVAIESTPQGDVSVIADYMDYREVSGVAYPYKIKRKMGPQNMDMEVTEIKVNGKIGADVFKAK